MTAFPQKVGECSNNFCTLLQSNLGVFVQGCFGTTLRKVYEDSGILSQNGVFQSKLDSRVPSLPKRIYSIWWHFATFFNQKNLSFQSLLDNQTLEIGLMLFFTTVCKVTQFHNFRY